MACDKKKIKECVNYKELVLVKEMGGIRLEMIWLPGSSLTFRSGNSSRIIYFKMEIA